jgi:hypothetical protein
MPVPLILEKDSGTNYTLVALEKLPLEKLSHINNFYLGSIIYDKTILNPISNNILI